MNLLWTLSKFEPTINVSAHCISLFSCANYTNLVMYVIENFLFLSWSIQICNCLCVSVSDAGFHIVPDRLQLFQYESVSFHCDSHNGSTEFRGIRNMEGFLSACHIKQRLIIYCTVHRAYPADSGKYWCETKSGERSNTVNITVTGNLSLL